MNRLLPIATCAALLSLAGCGEILNPQVVSTALGTGGPAVSLPGDAPALRVGVENRTARTVQMLVSWRDADDQVQQSLFTLQAGASNSQAVVCSVPELTLGDVGNLESIGAVVVLGSGTVGGDGTPIDPVIDVEPFGVLLREGANYNCGDYVNFAVVRSSATRSGYQVIAFIQRSQVNP